MALWSRLLVKEVFTRRGRGKGTTVSIKDPCPKPLIRPHLLKVPSLFSVVPQTGHQTVNKWLLGSIQDPNCKSFSVFEHCVLWTLEV